MPPNVLLVMKINAEKATWPGKEWLSVLLMDSSFIPSLMQKERRGRGKVLSDLASTGGLLSTVGLYSLFPVLLLLEISPVLPFKALESCMFSSATDFVSFNAQKLSLPISESMKWVTISSSMSQDKRQTPVD